MQLANAPTNAQDLRSSYLARANRWITAKTIAVETPNMSTPFAASSGPSNRHDGVIRRSPYPSEWSQFDVADRVRRSRADFEAWTKSEAFRLAHHGAGQNRQHYLGQTEFEGFEVIQTVDKAKP
jgi:hypothetical protein